MIYICGVDDHGVISAMFLVNGVPREEFIIFRFLAFMAIELLFSFAQEANFGMVHPAEHSVFIIERRGLAW